MKQADPLAVLADIHGNSAALTAVLDHARARGLTRFVNLGDTFYGPLDPAGTWRILQQNPMDTVLGNQDRFLLETSPERERIPGFSDTVRAVGRDGMAWLGSLPATLRIEPDVLLCHGTPASDTAYLLEDVTTGLPAMRECDAILKDLDPDGTGCTLVLTGHSHHAGLAVCEGVTVVNPGSVGLPAYDDDEPPHVMASGSPHARYAVVSRTKSGWDAEFVEVEYDWESTAALAAGNGREDWSRWLLTGLG